MRLLCDNGLSLPAARKAGNKEFFTPNTSVWVTALGRVLAILEQRRAVAYPLCVSEVKVVPGKEKAAVRVLLNGPTPDSGIAISTQEEGGLSTIAALQLAAPPIADARGSNIAGAGTAG